MCCFDIATADPNWMAWSEAQSRDATRHGVIYINPIIYAEVCPSFGSAIAVEQWLDPAIFKRAPIPFEAGWLAAQAFVAYRRGGGVRNAPLPDFYIGAHAEVERLTLITRDAARYSTYFPGVKLISP